MKKLTYILIWGALLFGLIAGHAGPMSAGEESSKVAAVTGRESSKDTYACSIPFWPW